MTVKIWADLGGSTLKILVEMPNKSTVPIIMSSRVIELDDWLVSNRTVAMFDISPQADAIVRFGKGYYAVGKLAEQYASDVTNSTELKQPKQNTAIPKLLAVVGIIKQKYELPTRFAVELTLLLPFPEYQFVKDGGNNFQADLKKALSYFEFRGENYEVNLANFGCKPEGSGLIMLRYLQQQDRQDWLLNSKIAALMLGHRNTSILLYDYGTPSGYTNNLGFYQIIQTVIDSSLGQSAAALTEAIYKANDDISPNNPHIQALAMTKGKSKRAELTRLVKAIASAQKNRWQQIASWAKLLVDDVDELIIGGGTALLYQKAIRETFHSTRLFWAVATEKEPIPQIPPQPIGPSGHREEWENKLLAAKPGHDALKAKEALEQYEEQLLSYQQQQADYELQLKVVQAALSREKLPLLQLQHQSQAIIEEIAQTFFSQEVKSDERRFRVTQFVDIYGVWKAIENA
ncbi:ParM/StbA family protein [Planktothrix sp. FACHB-1355]|uniref:ParM/StbA family protein n=2 Tax=Aerosakkonema funiforme TaxID=1246630 RepID=A0A926ZGE5_9CYAN|nr:ParM/StbA family protein [Planktothrix sp. FACHB-1355]MBD2181880.1 ParM/StbA family protein [Aerosakkonema funiforme FACHB-1375]MBD3557300.1 ParM/StbA family protein [Planktothrix sp. FACHB-1355]